MPILDNLFAGFCFSLVLVFPPPARVRTEAGTADKRREESLKPIGQTQLKRKERKKSQADQ